MDVTKNWQLTCAGFVLILTTRVALGRSKLESAKANHLFLRKPPTMNLLRSQQAVLAVQNLGLKKLWYVPSASNSDADHVDN